MGVEFCSGIGLGMGESGARETLAEENHARRSNDAPCMKGAAPARSRFTVGGVEVLLTPRAARAQGVPLRTLSVGRRRRSMRWARRSCPAPAGRITHFVDQQIPFRRRRRCSRRAFSTSGRLMRISIGRRSARSIARAKRSTAAAVCTAQREAEQRSSSTICARTRSRAGKGRRGRSSISCCAATRSTSSTAPWTATPRSASRTCPHRADQEVVTWRTKK